MKRAILTGLAWVLLAVPVLAQNIITTSLASGVGTVTASTAQTYTLASGAGIQAGYLLLVDQEIDRVQTVAGANVTVIRAVGGLQSGHGGGASVLVGPASLFQTGNPSSASCTFGAAQNPWINQITGESYICGLTGSWQSLNNMPAPGPAGAFLTSNGPNAGQTWSTSFPVADGSAAAPSLTFASDPDTGFYGGTTLGANTMAQSLGGTASTLFTGAQVRYKGAYQIGFSSGDPTAVAADTTLERTAAGKVLLSGTTPMIQMGGTSNAFPALRRTGTALESRLADDSGAASFLGTFYTAADTGAMIFGARSQVFALATGTTQVGNIAGTVRNTFQTTGIPSCTASCGTSPSVVGTDTAFIVTMGASGSPASPFTVTFNGTWSAAPACQVQMALAGMVVGKLVLTAATTTTTVVLATNGTPPSTSDKYAILCVGVQ